MDVRSVCERTKRAANGFMTVGSDVKNDLLKAIKKAVISDFGNHGLSYFSCLRH